MLVLFKFFISIFRFGKVRQYFNGSSKGSDAVTIYSSKSPDLNFVFVTFNLLSPSFQLLPKLSATNSIRGKYDSEVSCVLLYRVIFVLISPDIPSIKLF